MQENVIPHNFSISKEDREAIKGHRPLLLWFMGIPHQ
ncbi:MAG: adenylylsulfate kinase [Candidatus Latescibacterota bacterium]|jgi:adenylylsulfate kinase